MEQVRTEERRASVAAPLHERIVQPMVDELTGRFPHAFSAHFRTANGLVSECRFVPIRRYPASARLRVALEWDRVTGTVWLSYAAEVQPLLVPFEGSDRYDIGLTPPGPAEVRHWVEAKLLAFLEVYLRAVEYGSAADGGTWRTDPVCGIRESFGAAGHTYAWDGRTYWLCSQACSSSTRTAIRPTTGRAASWWAACCRCRCRSTCAPLSSTRSGNRRPLESRARASRPAFA